jgi:hypothetical protein
MVSSMPAFIDIKGQKFGRLTVVERTGTNAGKQPIWLCRCECGGHAYVPSNALRGGKSKSCGCWNLEVRRAVVVLRNTTHGGSKTPEYRTWRSINDRCHNPNDTCYEAYGARGIAVCDRWRESFANFIADMGQKPTPKHTIDRIDGTKGYSPDNCRWATMLEQQNNRLNNHFIEAFGKRRPIMEWSRMTGIGRATIWNRIVRLGWSPEQALTASKWTRIKRHG